MSHELDAAIAAAGFGRYEAVLLREVREQLYGRSKAKTARLSATETANALGVQRQALQRALADLQAKGVLLKIEDGSFRFIKDYESWKALDGSPLLSPTTVEYVARTRDRNKPHKQASSNKNVAPSNKNVAVKMGKGATKTLLKSNKNVALLAHALYRTPREELDLDVVVVESVCTREENPSAAETLAAWIRATFPTHADALIRGVPGWVRYPEANVRDAIGRAVASHDEIEKPVAWVSSLLANWEADPAARTSPAPQRQAARPRASPMDPPGKPPEPTKETLELTERLAERMKAEIRSRHS